MSAQIRGLSAPSAGKFREDKALKKKVSNVITLTYAEGKTTTAKAAVAGVEKGTYYLAPTDEFGDPVSDESFNLVQKGETAKENQNYTTITVKKTEGGKEAAVLEYQYTEYPADDFSYEASITLIKQVKNYDGKAKKVTEDFYAMLYTDADHKEALLEEMNKNMKNISKNQKGKFSLFK